MNKKKIFLAAIVCSIIVLPWLAFHGDVKESQAFHSWESNYNEVANDPWHCRVFGC